MSKVHEALRRAEREREEARRSGDLPAVAEPERPAAATRAAEPADGATRTRAAEPASAPARASPVPSPAPPEPTADRRSAATAEPAAQARTTTTAEPAGRVKSAAAAEPRVRAPSVPLPERTAPPDLRLDDALVAFTKPRSLAAEQFRAIRQQLAVYAREVPMRTIVVTSPLAGEGKTTTASNLAIALGQELGRRICLVDCDLRSPGIGALFGLPSRDGLADVLRRRAGLDSVLVSTPVNDLWVVPAGHLPPNPAELLASNGMREVVETLAARFDLVVLDTPPVIPVPDPAILSGLADGVVLVLQAGHTPRRLLDRTLDRLHGAVLLGFVLNRTDEFRYYADYYQYDYGA
ncbi:MAG TPA: CpsD/CapB family tyrosine-protein kinase [Thermodesulfobacteriota bacterium]